MNLWRGETTLTLVPIVTIDASAGETEAASCIAAETMILIFSEILSSRNWASASGEAWSLRLGIVIPFWLQVLVRPATDVEISSASWVIEVAIDGVLKIAELAGFGAYIHGLGIWVRIACALEMRKSTQSGSL